MSIGSRIILLRKSMELTQAQFASKIGLRKQTISEYEANNLNPSENTIFRICQTFGQDKKWLVDGIGEMAASPAPEVAEKTAPDNLTEAEKCFLWLKDYLDLSDNEARKILQCLKDDKFPYLLLADLQATGDKKSVKLLKSLFPELND